MSHVHRPALSVTYRVALNHASAAVLHETRPGAGNFRRAEASATRSARASGDAVHTAPNPTAPAEWGPPRRRDRLLTEGERDGPVSARGQWIRVTPCANEPPCPGSAARAGRVHGQPELAEQPHASTAGRLVHRRLDANARADLRPDPVERCIRVRCREPGGA
jgi:hypothetical protein